MSESIIFSNTRGFKVKKDKVDKFVQEHKPAVFLVADHYQCTPDHLRISGYDLAGLFCRNVMEKGGVAIFVRKDIEHKPREDLNSFCESKQFEVTSVELPSKNIVVSVVNRPNTGDIDLFHTKLDEILKITNIKTTMLKVNYLMAGTFNLLERNDFCNAEEILKKNNFKFAISEITHINKKKSDDFIINFNETSKGVIPTRFSDHWCIQLGVPMKQEKQFGGVMKDKVFPQNILPLGEDPRERQIINLRTKEVAIKNPADIDVMQETKFGGVVKDKVFSQKYSWEDLRERQISDIRTKEVAIKNPVDIGIMSQVLNYLISDDFMDRLTTKLSDKLKERPPIQCVCDTTLTKSLEEVKQQIQGLDKKVTSFEAILKNIQRDIPM